MRNSNYANAYNSGTLLGRFMRSLLFAILLPWMSGATPGRPPVSLPALLAFNRTFASHREAFFPRIHLGLDPTEMREAGSVATRQTTAFFRGTGSVAIAPRRRRRTTY
jgi:hypothetical protein